MRWGVSHVPDHSHRLRSSATSTRSPGPPLALSAHLTVDRIRVPFESVTKSDILREMSQLLAHVAGAEHALDDIHRAIVNRESLLTTGVGRGIALPHAKCQELDRLEIVAGTTREPMDFLSMDEQPVRILFMLVGPATSAGQHARTLAHISRAVRDDALRTGLIAAAGAEEFLRVLAAAEA